MVEATYISIKEHLKESGINSFVFTSQLPVHNHVPDLETKTEQIKDLVDKKSAFGAGW